MKTTSISVEVLNKFIKGVYNKREFLLECYKFARKEYPDIETAEKLFNIPQSTYYRTIKNLNKKNNGE